MSNPTPHPAPAKWYHFVAAFFAGAFLANFVPHFVTGICGNPFPSPFADPPGKGLSSPTVNVCWALFNLLVGYLLYRAAKMTPSTYARLIVFFIGIVAMSIQLSIVFVDKHTV